MDHERGYDDRAPDDAGRINARIERYRLWQGIGGRRSRAALFSIEQPFELLLEDRHETVDLETPLFTAILLAATALSAAPAKRTFTGVITDDMCANGDHSHMQMGPTDAECTLACVSAHGALYVLYDGKYIYTLSDQQTPGKVRGQEGKCQAQVRWTTRASAIKVESITAAK